MQGAASALCVGDLNAGRSIRSITPSFPRRREPSAFGFTVGKSLGPRLRGDDGSLSIDLVRGTRLEQGAAMVLCGGSNSMPTVKSVPSHRRSREGGNPVPSAYEQESHWVPACAGMTALHSLIWCGALAWNRALRWFYAVVKLHANGEIRSITPSFPRRREPSAFGLRAGKSLGPRLRGDDGSPFIDLVRGSHLEQGAAMVLCGGQAPCQR
jgi:hypothetical protein